MFLFVAWYWALGIIAIGLVGSTIVTLSPDQRVADDPLSFESEETP